MDQPRLYVPAAPKANENDISRSAAREGSAVRTASVGGRSSCAKRKKAGHKFWDTQPVPKMDDTVKEEEEGAVDKVKTWPKSARSSQATQRFPR